ncbi:hypothetical protein IL306_003698 [Fusarium sp. DS 682]|nr:hypothetical protein IL306_003698 [Fusarium sp. DS 682]
MADTAKQPLSARTALRINDQITREVFRLVGRDPKDHVECFKACLKTIETTKVIEATDYATWEKQDPIANALEEFFHTNRTTKSNNFYMIPATTAVAIAATLNMKNVVIKPDSNHQNIISVFSKSAIWAYLGLAIDIWTQTGESLFFVKKPEDDSKFPTVGKIARGKFAVTTKDSGDTITPLMLLTMARSSGWVKSAPGALCLKKGTADAPQIIHRRQALSEGKGILDRLGNRKFKQNDSTFIKEVKAWLSEPIIRVLPEEAKNRLCADEDLSVWKYTGKTGAVLASLISDDIDWVRLVQQVKDAESTAAVKKLVELSDKAREIQISQQTYLQEAVPNLMELRTALLEQPGNQSFQQVFGPAWNQCLLNQEADGTKNIIVGALQRLFDTIAYVVDRKNPMYGAFLDLASKMDVAVMSSLDLDLARAKDRHGKRLNFNDELSYRNEIVANVAEAVGKLDRGSASQELLLRSKLCSILDSADALILKENLPGETNIVAPTNTNEE